MQINFVPVTKRGFYFAVILLCFSIIFIIVCLRYPFVGARPPFTRPISLPSPTLIPTPTPKYSAVQQLFLNSVEKEWSIPKNSIGFVNPKNIIDFDYDRNENAFYIREYRNTEVAFSKNYGPYIMITKNTLKNYIVNTRLIKTYETSIYTGTNKLYYDSLHHALVMNTSTSDGCCSNGTIWTISEYAENKVISFGGGADRSSPYRYIGNTNESYLSEFIKNNPGNYPNSVFNKLIIGTVDISGKNPTFLYKSVFMLDPFTGIRHTLLDESNLPVNIKEIIQDASAPSTTLQILTINNLPFGSLDLLLNKITHE